jgi:hypothetical protein
MPLPLLIGAAAIGSALFGAKKGLDAKANYKKAKSLIEDATSDLEAVKSRLDNQKKRTNSSLENLGKVRLTHEGQLMKRFVDMAQRVNQVSYRPITLGASKVQISAPELKEIELSAYQAADLMKDGAGALSSGVLAGVGAGGLATTFGVASTGTAIGSLTGVAATNATLAWLGGGSLAAGGMGVAGGTAVLGGVIAGPVLLAMGFAAAKKSEKALTEAFEQEAEIREAIEQVENGITVLSAITERAEELRGVIDGVARRFAATLSLAEQAVSARQAQRDVLQAEADRKKAEYAAKSAISKFFARLKGQKGGEFTFSDPLDFDNFSETEKATYTTATSFGYALNNLLKIKLLDDDGDLTRESATAITEGGALLKG